MTTIEIDGITPDADRLWTTVSGYGHFTAMQVRGGRARGLSLHMARLEAGNREAFGVGLDADRVRMLIRHALAEVADASVRVYLYEGPRGPVTMITVKPPAEMASPQRVLSVRYQRPNAHIKHVTTDQGHYREQAQRQGYDDALLTSEADSVSETTIANIGFFDGSGVVWPDAPMLRGITMQLLERELPEAGTPVRRSAVHLQDVASFEGAFLSNARGLAAVSGIDDVELPVRPAGMSALIDAYAAASWDVI